MSRGHDYSDHLRSLVGRRFGPVMVLSVSGGSRKVLSTAEVLCDCGRTRTLKTGELGRSAKRSKCRCNALPSGIAWTEGRKTPEYETYCSMMSRCYNSRTKYFRHYGGRGISVCDSWRADFRNFLADMGKRPVGKTLERRDNNLGYSPENCEWATVSEQCNNRRDTIFIEHLGVRRSLANWARELGKSYWTLVKRFKRGLPPEQVLSTEVLRRAS